MQAAYEFPDVSPWVRGSFVTTLDGVIRGQDGTSRSIATAADQRIFSILRSAADVVLVGAGTIRDENYRPSQRPIAIVSASADLPLSLRLFTDRTDESPRTLVLTTAIAIESSSADLRDAADLIDCGHDRVDLRLAVDALTERGLIRIHCEGGPRLLGDLAAAGLLDEVLLTVTPTLQGGTPPEHLLDLPGGLLPAMRMRTTQVLEEDGSVFIRAQREAQR